MQGLNGSSRHRRSVRLDRYLSLNCEKLRCKQAQSKNRFSKDTRKGAIHIQNCSRKTENRGKMRGSKSKNIY
jgi:hypothetical protein